MSFLLRSAKPEDVEQLLELSRQFTLLNLPSNRRVLAEMIDESVASFSGQIKSEDGLYLFVAEDLDNQVVVASSLIHGRCGTPESPNYSYKITKKDMFSRDLGIGFIHQVLHLKADDNGPTEIGGLLVDRHYRRRPEKVGKQISFFRFAYIGQFADRFTDEIHVELAPPLTDEGRSEFWEALGRRFTGLPYQEADSLSQTNKEFISSLFPPEDVYLCLLDSKARLVLGRVGEETRAAQYMLEKIGFKYIDEVDPFDGGPHYRAKAKELTPVAKGKIATVSNFSTKTYSQQGIIGFEKNGAYQGGLVGFEMRENELSVSPVDCERLHIDTGTQVFISPA